MAEVKIVVTHQDGTTNSLERLGYTSSPEEMSSLVSRTANDMREYLDSLERRAKVILFKDTGMYYIEEEWRVPFGAIGPYDMERSPDFRRIGEGKVLVETQEPWGFPHLL